MKELQEGPWSVGEKTIFSHSHKRTASTVTDQHGSERVLTDISRLCRWNFFLFSQGEVLKLDTSTQNHNTRANSTNPGLVPRLLGGDLGSTSALCKFEYLHCFTKIPQRRHRKREGTQKSEVPAPAGFLDSILQACWPG